MTSAPEQVHKQVACSLVRFENVDEHGASAPGRSTPGPRASA
jgi:hypothetical protein